MCCWQTLVLRQNRITSIEGLASLTQLEELDLYDNLIEEIQGLAPLTALVCVFGPGARCASSKSDRKSVV